MSDGKKNDRKMIRTRVYTSLLLAILALVAVTAATVAWFSIADKTKVNTMGLNVTGDRIFGSTWTPMIRSMSM